MEDTLKYLQGVFNIKDDKASKCRRYKEMATNMIKKSEYNTLNLEVILKPLNI